MTVYYDIATTLTRARGSTAAAGKYPRREYPTGKDERSGDQNILERLKPAVPFLFSGNRCSLRIPQKVDYCVFLK